MGERLTVLIPCLNEERNLEATVRDIQAVVPDLDVDVEILMIDDGSTDGTERVMQELCDRYDNCRYRQNPENLGLGRTVLDTHEVVPPDTWLTIIPGDNEFIFESIRNHLAVRHEYDFILGYVQNQVIRPFRRRVASAAFRNVIKHLYGYDYRYLNGFLMYRAADVQGIEVVSGGHAFVPELLAKAQLRRPELRIGEVAFWERGRRHGASNAFKPGSVVRAIYDVGRGYSSVARFRQRVTSDGD